MTDTEQDQLPTLEDVLLENQRLLIENNELLRKMDRSARIGFWLRILSLFIIIGAPFVLYYWFLEPYFNAFGSSFEVFIQGMQELPGWKQFYESNGSPRG